MFNNSTLIFYKCDFNGMILYVYEVCVITPLEGAVIYGLG